MNKEQEELFASIMEKAVVCLDKESGLRQELVQDLLRLRDRLNGSAPAMDKEDLRQEYWDGVQGKAERFAENLQSMADISPLKQIAKMQWYQPAHLRIEFPDGSGLHIQLEVFPEGEW